MMTLDGPLAPHEGARSARIYRYTLSEKLAHCKSRGGTNQPLACRCGASKILFSPTPATCWSSFWDIPLKASLPSFVRTKLLTAKFAVAYRGLEILRRGLPLVSIADRTQVPAETIRRYASISAIADRQCQRSVSKQRGKDITRTCWWASRIYTPPPPPAEIS